MTDRTVLEVPGPGGVTRTIRLSSPDRVIWSDCGITKAELADYVLAVAGPLVAVLADRPVTLQRFPSGVGQDAFYSKNPPKGMPDWMRSVMVRYPSGRSHPQLVVDEPAAAVWAVQMGTVTFHPWPVHTVDGRALDNPDELRIDLDPQPGRGFADAVEAARTLRQLLTELELTAFVKTSGHRGVHVFAPIEPTHEFLDVRHAVIGIARELERRRPDLVTTAWWKEERGNRVFVDFNQATRDRTMASAYSPRGHRGAPVSTPLQWEELSHVDPAELTVRTVPQRLARHGDPWAQFGQHPGSVGPALALWDADVERGLGELPFPPDHPKMPGEPPRVQPSRARRSARGTEPDTSPADPAEA